MQIGLLPALRHWSLCEVCGPVSCCVVPVRSPSAVRKNPRPHFFLFAAIAMLGRMPAVAGAVSRPTVTPARQDAP